MVNILFVSADSSKRHNFHTALTKFGAHELQTVDSIDRMQEVIANKKFDCIFLESIVYDGKSVDADEKFVLLTNVFRQIKMLGHVVGDVIYIVDNDTNEITKEAKKFPLVKKLIKRNDLWIAPMALNQIDPIEYNVIPKSYTG